MRTTAPGQSALLLVDIIEILDQKKIPYAIIGAFAASFYGVVRASVDADAVVSLLTRQDSMDLCEDLKANGLKVEDRRGDVDDPIARVINIKDRFSNRVDLLMGIRGMQQEAFSRAKKVNFLEVPIKIVSLEDFIAMKIFAGNPIDISDVKGVLEVSGAKINMKILERLTAAYGADCLKKLKVILRK